MGSTFRRLRHAIRSLMGDIGFTGTVVLTIAVCIAANTATFAIIVDQRLARHFWPDRNPIGRRMYLPQDIHNLLKTDEHTRWMPWWG